MFYFIVTRDMYIYLWFVKDILLLSISSLIHSFLNPSVVSHSFVRSVDCYYAYFPFIVRNKYEKLDCCVGTSIFPLFLSYCKEDNALRVFKILPPFYYRIIEFNSRIFDRYLTLSITDHKIYKNHKKIRTCLPYGSNHDTQS